MYNKVKSVIYNKTRYYMYNKVKVQYNILYIYNKGIKKRKNSY